MNKIMIHPRLYGHHLNPLEMAGGSAHSSKGLATHVETRNMRFILLPRPQCIYGIGSILIAAKGLMLVLDFAKKSPDQVLPKMVARRVHQQREICIQQPAAAKGPQNTKRFPHLARSNMHATRHTTCS